MKYNSIIHSLRVIKNYNSFEFFSLIIIFIVIGPLHSSTCTYNKMNKLESRTSNNDWESKLKGQKKRQKNKQMGKKVT